MALFGVVGAAFVTVFSFVGITIIAQGKKAEVLLVPIYVVVLIGWVVVAFKFSGNRSE